MSTTIPITAKRKPCGTTGVPFDSRTCLWALFRPSNVSLSLSLSLSVLWEEGDLFAYSPECPRPPVHGLTPRR